MLIEMAKVVQEEYEEEFPDDKDPNTKMAWKTGLQSYSSNSVDYLLEHHDEYPLTLVLFYDSNILDEKIMRYMIITLLHLYVVKKEVFLRSGYDPSSDEASTVAFDLAFPIVLENVSCNL